VKKCKTCKAEFVQYNTLQTICVSCAIIKGRKKTVKDAKTANTVHKRELAAQKERIKSRQDWIKEAQQAFNAWIRQRDIDDPCISCQRYHTGQYHAGHYRTTKAAPELRFHEANVHKQCSVCNNHLSGNILEYRINLIKKLGIDSVTWIEGSHEPAKYTIEDLKFIKRKYQLMLKDLNEKA